MDMLVAGWCANVTWLQWHLQLTKYYFGIYFDGFLAWIIFSTTTRAPSPSLFLFTVIRNAASYTVNGRVACFWFSYVRALLYGTFFYFVYSQRKNEIGDCIRQMATQWFFIMIILVCLCTTYDYILHIIIIIHMNAAKVNGECCMCKHIAVCQWQKTHSRRWKPILTKKNVFHFFFIKNIFSLSERMLCNFFCFVVFSLCAKHARWTVASNKFKPMNALKFKHFHCRTLSLSLLFAASCVDTTG